MPVRNTEDHKRKYYASARAHLAGSRLSVELNVKLICISAVELAQALGCWIVFKFAHQKNLKVVEWIAK